MYMGIRQSWNDHGVPHVERPRGFGSVVPRADEINRATPRHQRIGRNSILGIAIDARVGQANGFWPIRHEVRRHSVGKLTLAEVAALIKPEAVKTSSKLTG
jgi:hypothetical protein